jgi:cysteine desulfurase/selenocysteine lyase
MFASNGVGVLWTSDRARQLLWPLRVGGKSKSIECAGSIDFDRTALANIVECGTLNIPSILSLGAAAKFIQSTNILTIQEHVSGLTRYLLQNLRQIPALEFAPRHRRLRLHKRLRNHLLPYYRCCFSRCRSLSGQ